MNIRDLKYVVAVAEEKHFGRAADKCHISQPALSGQIRKLEDGLGVILFERTNRSVQVTPVGEKIVTQARRLLLLADEILATAQAAKDPLSGQFRLGMITTVGPYLSPLILSAIRRELPNLSLTLMEGLTPGLETALANGDLDCAIMATVPGDIHLRNLALYDEPFWIALSNRHPLAEQKTINLRDVPHAELLLLSDGHCLRDQVLDACHANTGTENVNTRETSLETLLALVAAGEGITLVPALTRPSENRRHESIIMRREASGSAGRTVRLVYRASFPRLELLTRLASIIRTSVPEAMVGILN